MENAITVKDVTKIYKLYDKPIDRLKEALNPFHKEYHKKFYALNNLSFEVKKGETVGIIGTNGSGKSTILKIITGVLTPTTGEVEVNGVISALLELGAGFNMDYTGIENIYMNGLERVIFIDILVKNELNDTVKKDVDITQELVDLANDYKTFADSKDGVEAKTKFIMIIDSKSKK